MDATQGYSDPLLDQIEARERRSRWRAVLLTIIPIFFALALLLFTANQLQAMNAELAAKQKELVVVEAQLSLSQAQVDNADQALQKAETQLTVTQLQLEKTQTELEQTQNDLKQTQALLASQSDELAALTTRFEALQQDFQKLEEEYNQLIDSMRDVRGQAYAGKPLVVLKELANQGNFTQSDLLARMLFDHENTPWKAGGLSPEVGFDSPGFAAYMLEQFSLLSAPAAEVRYNLRQVLPPTSQPSIGDVVFYDLGYTMFYFEDEKGEPFVVGMTPLGVLALKLDFMKVLGYGQVEYP